jgi:hypothetical protein
MFVNEHGLMLRKKPYISLALGYTILTVSRAMGTDKTQLPLFSSFVVLRGAW